MSLLTAVIVKNSQILAGIYLNFLLKKNRSYTKIERLSIPNLDISEKRSEKQLSSKTNFCTFLQISCSNFWLKLCQRSQIYKNCQANQTCVGRVKIKKLFPETMIHKIFETNFSFHEKQRKLQFLFFRKFLLVLTKFSFWEEDEALENNSMQFWYFFYVFEFPKIPSLKNALS